MGGLKVKQNLTRIEIIEKQLIFSLGALPIAERGIDVASISKKIAKEIDGTLKRFEMLVKVETGQ